ncbi:MAG: tRNA(Ile)(2)-agmatinylcytidine synthase [Methanomassiliicoccus sp.]|nr:tRNA(Ile)(2)-agmatinylcytidine synthase [Methanomassiliicoccus sp.]
MFIAADDTDSSTWMCTTFLATELVRALSDHDLIGLPRLVRLNPAVPWKTRGNGAICIRVGRGIGQPRLCGHMDGKDVLCYARSQEDPDPDEIMARCWPVVERWSQRDDSDPGLVVTAEAPEGELYRHAVRRIIDKEEALAALRGVGARTFEINSGRGLIGAAAAAAWRPMDRTYEVLAYRERERWGRPREVSPEDIALLDRRFPSTFNNYEHVAGRPAIVPHTTCPVLYGIRGDSPLDLVKAASSVASEPVDRWLMFITNQGTDDHIITAWDRLVPNSSYLVEGNVATMPATIPGGHVIFALSTRDGDVDCAAYEPSKGFRAIVRQLRPGDRVQVMGELREAPRTLNIEKLNVLSLARSMVKLSNPPCPACGRRTKSAGQGQGYRCRECGTKGLEATMQEEVRQIGPGWYEPPVCTRRHLSKPLKRMGVQSTIVV